MSDSIRRIISETLQQLRILKSKGLNRETIPQVRDLYEKCITLAKTHNESVYVLYDYVGFLYELNDYLPAIEAARWLLNYYQTENETEEIQAPLKNLMGNLLSKNNQMDEAEAFYREALDSYRRLTKENSKKYEPDVATICNNLAVLLQNTNRMAEAEEQYREALTIRRRLAKTNPAAYEPDVAMICNNLANLLSDTNRMAEAEEQYGEALRLYRRLAETNSAAYEPYVATTCFNLGFLLRDTSRIAEAKPLFEEAARLWDKYPHHSGDAQDARDVLNILFP